MNLDRVGYHASLKFLLAQEDSFFKAHKTFQVFVGSPRRLVEPSYTDIALFKNRHPEVEVVVHAPYVVSLCKEQTDKNYIATLSYLIKVAKKLDSLGVKYLVTHIGARKQDMSVKASAVSILNFCFKWLMATQGCNIQLCLENDSGSKKGTKMGHIKVLGLVIRKINSPRIRMCYDVEHSYAAGFDCESVDELSKLKDIVSVVHWNAVPSYVESGSHLDRHSETSFYESKINNMVQYEVLYDGQRPFIFEVKSKDYYDENIRWLKEKSNESID